MSHLHPGPTPPEQEKTPPKSRLSGRLTFGLLSTVLLAILVAKSVVIFTNGQAPPTADMRQYWNLATIIASGDLTSTDHPVFIFRPPLYPAFLAIPQLLAPSGALPLAAAMQQLGVLLTALVAGWATAVISGSRAGFLVALAVSVLCMERSWFAMLMYADNLLALWFALLLAWALVWRKNKTWATAMAIGIWLGLGILIKPVVQYLWIPMIIWMGIDWWLTGKKTPTRALATQFLIVMIATVATTLPWAMRNAALYDEVFISRVDGSSLWWAAFHRATANLPFESSPAVDRIFERIPIEYTIATYERNRDAWPPDAYPYKSLSRKIEYFRKSGTEGYRNSWNVKALLEETGLGPIETQNWMAAAARETLLAHPLTAARAFAANAYIFWNAYTFFDNDHILELPKESRTQMYHGLESWPEFRPRHESILYRPLSRSARRMLDNVAAGITIFALCAMIASRKTRSYGLLLAVMIGYINAFSSLGSHTFRYRLSIEPLMVVASSWLVVDLARRIGNIRREPRSEPETSR